MTPDEQTAWEEILSHLNATGSVLNLSPSLFRAADAEVKRLRALLNIDHKDLVDESFDIGGWNKLTAEEQWAVRNTFIELRRRAKEG